MWGCRLYEWIGKSIHQGIVKYHKYGLQQHHVLFKHDLETSVSYPMIQNLSFAWQLHVMFFTTEACTIGPIFGPGHL